MINLQCELTTTTLVNATTTVISVGLHRVRQRVNAQ